jgi:hypothetical protein
MKGYLHILCCADSSNDVGSTTNPEARVLIHQSGDAGLGACPSLSRTGKELPTLRDVFLAERQASQPHVLRQAQDAKMSTTQQDRDV